MVSSPWRWTRAAWSCFFHGIHGLGVAEGAQGLLHVGEHFGAAWIGSRVAKLLGVKLGIKLEVELGVHLGSISGARTALRHVGPEEADRAQEGHVLEERE